MTRVAILGATGSIGRSTLEVVRRHPDRFRVVAVAARRSAGELAEIAAAFDVPHVAIADGEAIAECLKVDSTIQSLR